MKIQLIVGLALSLVASSAAAASIMTGGSDFDATDGDTANYFHGVTGGVYVGTTSATAVGAIKREIASAVDGSQTVTIDLVRNNTSTSLSGAVWSYNNSFAYMRSFWTTGADTSTAVTKSVTFPSSELSTTSYFSGVVYLAPNTGVVGARTN
jgi:hypothetical protein